MTGHSQISRVEEYLVVMQKKGPVRKQYGPLINALSERTGFSRIVIAEILEHTADAGHIALPFPRKNTGLVELNFDLERVYSPTEVVWANLLDKFKHTLDDKILSILHKKGTMVEGLTEHQLSDLLSGIAVIASTAMSDPRDRFELSAQNLLGSSKALGKLWPAQRQEPQTQDRFSYVVTAGPATPNRILLIENPVSFEACIRNGLDKDDLLICTFGFGVSWDAIVREKRPVYQLVRRGEFSNLPQLLRSREVYFWGDLDKAGLLIFADIRRTLPHLKLASLYRPLINAIHKGNCHPYVALVEKADQKKLIVPNFHDNPAYAMLTELCGTLAVDQEVATDEDISGLGISELQVID
ncbi:Wadjet anti-phage system protein JetD domain-containing protein [Thalassospira tepidiphila]|uniref:Wadjet anti-phage system protein JetD domain-containing protein n=1 Tax=Thalassospira tepidiphila TaxID=393657 RepID=UPI002920190F|nr:hypothetical protein MACH01_37700 [Thalassospira tepidiphila]